MRTRLLVVSFMMRTTEALSVLSTSTPKRHNAPVHGGGLGFLDGRRREERGGVHQVPARILGWEVTAVHMTRHGRHLCIRTHTPNTKETQHGFIKEAPGMHD